MTKIYRLGSTKLRALDAVSFELQRGEFCAITGPSGSGKSTLLNMLAGLERASRGSIRVAGAELNKLSESQLVDFRRKHVGFIFQSFNLIPTMNCIENIALPLTFQGISRRQRTKVAKKLLKLVSLEKRARHKPSELSGGQQQRIGVARALAAKPEIIFADEPTGNLDSTTSREILRLIRSISKKYQQTVVMVTHDLDLAQYADKIFILVDGRITRILRGRPIEDNALEVVDNFDKQIDALGLDDLVIQQSLGTADSTASDDSELDVATSSNSPKESQ
ncbi:MAG: ABC transporter ATP-binding protein [Eubacteriales bacterium]|nr:ABC transporter ATP-binding protein [Eubacteriales bacterium]